MVNNLIAEDSVERGEKGTSNLLGTRFRYMEKWSGIRFVLLTLQNRARLNSISHFTIKKKQKEVKPMEVKTSKCLSEGKKGISKKKWSGICFN